METTVNLDKVRVSHGAIGLRKFEQEVDQLFRPTALSILKARGEMGSIELSIAVWQALGPRLDRRFITNAAMRFSAGFFGRIAKLQDDHVIVSSLRIPKSPDEMTPGGNIRYCLSEAARAVLEQAVTIDRNRISALGGVRQDCRTTLA